MIKKYSVKDMRAVFLALYFLERSWKVAISQLTERKNMKTWVKTILLLVIVLLVFLSGSIQADAAENNELNYNYYYEYTYNQNGHSGMARREYSSEDELILIVDYDITGFAGGHSGSEGIIAPVYFIALVTPETGELVLTNSTSIYSYTKSIIYRTIYPGSTSLPPTNTSDVPYMKTIDKNGKVSYGSMLYYYDGLETNMKLFSSVEAAYEYATTGNDEGQINKPGSDASYDATLDNIKNLTIKGLTPNDCHNSVDSFTNCFQLSWDVPNYDKTLYMDFYEIKFDMQYSYMNYFGSSLKNSSGLIDYIVNGTKNSIAVSEGTHNFCAHDFVDILGLNDNLSSLDYINKFNITRLRKIYIRHVRVDRRSHDISFGNWSVFDVDYSNGIFSLNEKSVGDLNIYPGDSEIGSDGNFDSEPIESIPKPDKTPEFSFAGIDLDDIKSIGSYFIGLIQTLFNFLGDFPTLFSRVFAFLPQEILTMIYVCIVIICIAGLFKIFV